jgi:hypothetical protein
MTTSATSVHPAAPRWPRSLGVVALLAALAVTAAEEIPPPPPMPAAATEAQPAKAGAPASKCADCAVIRTIRTVERERSMQREVPSYMTSSQYLDTRRYSQPYVGPVVGMTFGPGQDTKTFVGAAGSPTMRQRMLEITYEITLLYDDGRYSVIEQSDLGSLREGDRARVVDGQVVLVPRE